ncbi:MAG: cobalamin B12-binding domain-containing protein [Thermacetogeniaceae bacterium]|jgi:dimethylamine corrinoid protein
MESNTQMLAELAKAVEELDEAKAAAIVDEALQKGLNPVDILQGVVAGLKAAGHRFEINEYYLLELMEVGEIGKKLINTITPHLPSLDGSSPGRVVIGSTKGDIHDIGKNLIITQLQVAGFEVYDLGVDVPSLTFIDKAQEVGADIIAMSAFLSTTMAYFAEVINYLKDMGLRDKFKVIVGGGTTDEAFAKSIGADGTAPDAIQAVKLCERLLSEKKEG